MKRLSKRKGAGIQLYRYYLNESGLLKGLLKKKIKTVNIVMVQVWGTANRKFEEDFKSRIKTFNSLVLGVMMYGIELIEWKESDEME